MDIGNIKENELEEKIKKLPFKAAIEFYIEIINYYIKTDKIEQFLTCHSFLKYIDKNFLDFKTLIEENNEIKHKLQELFKLNMEIKRDNLISIIIDDETNEKIVELLNNNLNFKDYYLTDNIMSIICTADISIYNDLKDKKKYIYSALYNIYYSREEQLKIYRNNLKNYPVSFIKKLFSFSEIICNNTPIDMEKNIKINKAMFDFTEKVIDNPKRLENYLHNIGCIFNNRPTEREIYNFFLISLKYPKINESLLNNKISSNDISKKIRLLSSLPSLKKINSIDDLSKISTEDLFKLETNNSITINKEPASATAKGDYNYEIFDNNRQIIKITEDQINIAQLTDDEYKTIDTDYSHIEGLRRLYPEYSDKEVPGEIIIPANSINHDIIMTTEGDSINIWLPNRDNITMSQINMLKQKLEEIRDISMISVQIAMECDGNYIEIPFTEIDILVDYLKTNKKVK